VRLVLGNPAAVYVWLAMTLAGVLASVAVGHAVWAVAGWAVGGVAAIIVAAVKTRAAGSTSLQVAPLAN
jgi:hypothetical protein